MYHLYLALGRRELLDAVRIIGLADDEVPCEPIRLGYLYRWRVRGFFKRYTRASTGIFTRLGSLKRVPERQSLSFAGHLGSC